MREHDARPQSGRRTDLCLLGNIYEIVRRTCPNCGATNPLEAAYCARCGHVMNLVGFLLKTRLPTGTPEHLEQVRAETPRIKAEAEAASLEWLCQQWAGKEERRRNLAAAQVERDRQERMLLTEAISLQLP